MRKLCTGLRGRGFPGIPTLLIIWVNCEVGSEDMSSLASQNDGHKYLLNAIDAFSIYASLVPMRSKTGEAVASAFRFLLSRTMGRISLVVRTDKGKEFVKAKFRKLLDGEEIEMGVCGNPDGKFVIVVKSPPIYSVGQSVRISKAKIQSAKGFE